MFIMFLFVSFYEVKNISYSTTIV